MTNKKKQKTNRWRIDPATILDVIATDFFEIAIISAVYGDKLSNNREWTSTVDCESAPSTIKGLITTRISVYSTTATVAAVGITRVVRVDGGLF